MRAAEHASSDRFNLLERRHGVAAIVERGASVLLERRHVVQPHYSLRGHCSSVGEVASVELLTRGFNGTQPTGSAVVQFYSAAAATAAIQDLNGTELNGRRLYVRAYFT